MICGTLGPVISEACGGLMFKCLSTRSSIRFEVSSSSCVAMNTAQGGALLEEAATAGIILSSLWVAPPLKTGKLGLPAPLLVPLPWGHLAAKCSSLSQMRHFRVFPARSLGFERRPNPFPLEPLCFPLPWPLR